METEPDLLPSGGFGSANVLLAERPDLKVSRMVEMVSALTGCDDEIASFAISEAVQSRGYPEDQHACLARVARAMGSIRSGLDLRAFS
jgi:hypothetical protein